jgi:hypothetical protein
MQRKTKLHKGDFGYSKIQRRDALLRTLFFFSVVLAVFLAGYLTTKSRLNVLTVVAVVGCLPACKQAVACFMICRKKPCSQSRFEQIEKTAGGVLRAYELSITSPKTVYDFDAACVCEKQILLLPHAAGKQSSREAKEFLKEILKNNEIEGCKIQIPEKESVFLEQLKAMAKKETPDSAETEAILHILLAISV